ncbi:MAG TPA: hypothetical protein VHG51_20270 [Longimicrobiaceae bacterium]|nr:hypothetical protein [Longimicrobiaceae bacterium]
MTDTVLVVVSQSGFWVEELLKPLDRLEKAGYRVQFAAPTREKGTPYPDPASFDPDYVDPPLGRPVTLEAFLREQAEKYGREPVQGGNGRVDWQATFREVWEPMFRDRIHLDEWLPTRPYLSDPAGGDGGGRRSYIERMEDYYEARDRAWERIGDYAGLLLVGGSGPMFDMVGNGAVHGLVLGFYYADKPIAAECYAVTCLAMARELDDRKSILSGRHVTGHTVEYDYTSGWAGYLEDRWVGFTGGAPFVLEYILRDAVLPDGAFHGNVGRKLSVIVDYPFITSRSVGESDLCGAKLVEALDGEKNGSRLLRYGWHQPGTPSPRAAPAG